MIERTAYLCRFSAVRRMSDLHRLVGACPGLTRQILTDKIRYRILRELEREPQLSQRELAESLGVSLGKTNYCLKALVEKGLVKVENFRPRNVIHRSQ